MKRVLVLISTLCLIIGFSVVSCVSDTEPSEQSEPPSTQEEQISQLESKISELESRIQEKQESYTSLLEEHTETLRELRELERAQTELENEYQALTKEYEDLQAVCDSSSVDNLERLKEQIAELESENSRLEAEVTRLNKRLIPSPDRALNPSEVWGNSDFKSTGWPDSYKLQTRVEEITQSYHNTHTYMKGEFDCDDIAVELWNMLLTRGIKSVIAVGNLEKSDEELSEVNHAWLYVFNADAEVFYLEPITGEVIYGRLANGSTNPEAIPYREAFIYEQPSDLWKDLGRFW